MHEDLPFPRSLRFSNEPQSPLESRGTLFAEFLGTMRFRRYDSLLRHPTTATVVRPDADNRIHLAIATGRGRSLIPYGTRQYSIRTVKGMNRRPTDTMRPDCDRLACPIAELAANLD